MACAKEPPDRKILGRRVRVQQNAFAEGETDRHA